MNHTRFYDQNFREVTPAGAAIGGSQTPWTSDINAAQFNLLNAASLQVAVGSDMTFYSFNEIDNSGNSSIRFGVGDPNFGIQNGETAGVGADINLVSLNGFLNVQSDSLEQIAVFQTAASSGAAFVQTYNSGSGAFCDFGVRSDGTGFFYSSLNIFEIGTGLGSLHELHSGKSLFGTTTDDGTGAYVQSFGDISAAGSYWASGSQGVSGTFTAGANTVTVTNGIVTSIV